MSISNLEKFIGTSIRREIGPPAFHGSVKGEVAWQGNSAFGAVAEGFDPSVANRWHQHPTEPIVRYAGWRCDAELRHWGYEPGPALGRRERVDVALTRGAGWLEERVGHWSSRARRSLVRKYGLRARR